jgi:formylglycine-generating enzyme required for sulfatase activity
MNDAVESMTRAAGVSQAPGEKMAWIPGGTFLMGSDSHYPEEAPAHYVSVSGFWIDRCEVTNAEFRRFVAATSHVTLAERPANQPTIPARSRRCSFRRRWCS